MTTDRYVVAKYKDIAFLSKFHKDQLFDIMRRLEVIRKSRGKGRLTCVVVENDWPEYEYVWDLLKWQMENTK